MSLIGRHVFEQQEVQDAEDGEAFKPQDKKEAFQPPVSAGFQTETGEENGICCK